MSDCQDKPSGLNCLPESGWVECAPWEISAHSQTNCYIDGLTQESLNIAGAQVNVYKMLGVHEQTQLTGLTGNGTAISSGAVDGFPSDNAFTVYSTMWLSRQVGPAVTAHAYIGYDFGVIRNSAGQARYGDDVAIRQHITSFKIKQSSESNQRATKVRVERSDDGKQWYGASVATLPDNDQLNLISFRHSVPSRFWRLRPLQFNGAPGDSWGIMALEMFDYQATALDNIQDKVLLENRDRQYNQTPITVKGYYDLLSIASELSRFGIEIPSAMYQIRVNFNAVVSRLGRPIVIGDIIDLPSETQYTPDLRPIKRYLEVTDVTWDSNSYTPGWQPTMLLVSTQPAMATQETQDVFGDLASSVDSSGLFSKDDGNNQTWQDYSAVDQAIRAEAQADVPKRGSLLSDTVREFAEEEIAVVNSEAPAQIQHLNYNPKALYVEDAMPPNSSPYTEGPQFPESPSNGDYHRVLYVGLAKDLPARLYRWSSTKSRWIYLETDKRSQYNSQKKILNEYLTSATKAPARDIK